MLVVVLLIYKIDWNKKEIDIKRIKKNKNKTEEIY
jgi:hypothetical protein